MKLNLGSGDQKFEGFTSVDLYDEKADVQADICDLPFEDGSADEVVAYQVVEHVPYNKSDDMFKEMYRVLQSGGIATIETPNVRFIAHKIVQEGITEKWIYGLVGQYYRPWDKERYDDWEMNAGSIHRNPWDFERIREHAERAGFSKVEILNEKVIDVPENLAVRLTK